MGDIHHDGGAIDAIHSLDSIGSIGSIGPMGPIKGIESIAPVAVHLKEINNIDPVILEPLQINDVRNIEPLRIQELNVTKLPMVNIAVRQLPSVDVNIRRFPALSVATHQNFCMPSNYVVHGRILGLELFRLHVEGQTVVVPKDRVRREQSRTPDRSFPVTAAAGEPGIPVVSKPVTSAVRCHPRTGSQRAPSPCRTSGPHRPCAVHMGRSGR